MKLAQYVLLIALAFGIHAAHACGSATGGEVTKNDGATANLAKWAANGTTGAPAPVKKPLFPGANDAGV